MFTPLQKSDIFLFSYKNSKRAPIAMNSFVDNKLNI